MTAHAYAFDAYGTLFDVHAAMARHRAALGKDAEAFSALWRVKQLEYSWTRSLMGRTRDFWQLTQDALDFCLARFPGVDPALRQPLLESYYRLDAFADARPALMRLRAAGTRCALFTNGTQAMAESAARSAGLADCLETIVSVEAIGRFKTVPEVYALVASRLGLPLTAVTLVSSNRWDIAGAAACGMPGIWINRTGQPDEYPDLAPVRVIAGLDGLPA